MLVVDVNKRYTINQIKGDRWIIQGEPYDFLEEEDDFLRPDENRLNETNLDEDIFEETCQLLGEEDQSKVREVGSLF